jgi:hypothetical protein
MEMASEIVTRIFVVSWSQHLHLLQTKVILCQLRGPCGGLLLRCIGHPLPTVDEASMNNHLIIGLGGPRDKKALPLSTRRGTHIPNRQEPEHPIAQLRAAQDIWQQSRPNARLRSLTSVYNCMGMIFASRRTCVEIGDLPWILKEDGYRQIINRDELRVGDVVVYGTLKELTHVGLVYEIPLISTTNKREIMVLSKWGLDGEYIHEMEYVPALFGRPVEFWTDRR